MKEKGTSAWGKLTMMPFLPVVFTSIGCHTLKEA
jgi:hypothetical protein